MNDSLIDAATLVLTIVEVFVGLGAVRLLGAIVALVWSRWRWEMFKRSIEAWLTGLEQDAGRHPKLLTEDEWRRQVANLLDQAYFGPAEVQTYLNLAVAFARGYAAERHMFEE